ncbi:hypothetical protein DL546_005161 [Coniochaeta pulveracea]|uniref:Extracellular matrix protein n=1 Tax=Coniochaeta pulveracea TaxID=177199 RepID=A0A420YDU6_9PEZI|nr:hypothetical protein DL546_005161 [Coniochaeta pulveracea]
MKFSAVLAVAAAAAVQAKVFFTNVQYVVKPNTPFELGWSNNTGAVTITLKNGPALALKDYLVIDSADTGKSFTWTPPANLPSDTYAFEIKDSADPSNPNYSPQWQYFASDDASSTSSGTASASGTSSPTPSASGSTSTDSSESTSTTGTPSSSGTAASTTSSASSTRHSSTSRTSTSASSTSTSTSSPQNTNNGQKFQSPLALVLVTVAALLYFN